MTVLPIVERELRIAARQAGSFWTRLAAAGVAVLVSATILMIFTAAGGGMPMPPGAMLFNALKYLSFVFACLAGVFLTADCLSEEKREGTLGLLFLTDLRGWDVVLGKLLATSLRAAYGLLAVFPVLAAALLMGGVTGGEFWRMILVLCNTLLLSLTLGLFVSSVTRQPQDALAGTLSLAVFVVLGLPGIDLLIAGLSRTSFVPRVTLLSPGFAFSEAGAMRLGLFWSSLGLTHGLVWLFLGLASYLAPRGWQERTATGSTARKSAGWGKRLRVFKPRPAWRRSLLEKNPMNWLAGRSPGLGRFTHIVALAAAGLLLVVLALSPNQQVLMIVGTMAVWPLVLLFKIAVASQASRFFVEAIRNGIMDLVLVTPVSVNQILRGHGWALRRAFVFPGLLILAFIATAAVVQTLTYAQAWATAGTGAGGVQGMLAYQVVNQISGLVRFVTGTLALAFFGTWMGLTERKAHVALIKTFVFVQVLPWLALGFMQGLLTLGMGVLFSGLMGVGRLPLWLVPTIHALFGVGIDVAFIRISSRKASQHLREFVAGVRVGRAPAQPPLPAKPPAQPPVPIQTAP